MLSLGQISLNLSLLIYLFLYLPQVIHNQKQANLDGLSAWMHISLYLAYGLDLLYGFGSGLPWQYKTVSAVGWLLLNIQHLQFVYHFNQKKQFVLQALFGTLLIVCMGIVIYGVSNRPFSHLSLSFLGYIAQVGFIIAFIPQILKSKQLQSAQAVNIIYILLGLLLAFLDFISAWQLTWGWPNKLGSLLAISLTGILLIQYWKYQHD